MNPEKQLPRSTPESQGIQTEGIQTFVEQADKMVHDMHSFMLVRHGFVVAEGWWKPYGPEIPHTLWSLSKSFTSTGVGLAVSEGLLSVDEPVISFFPKEAPTKPSENLAKMRVRHLLSMSTGHAVDTTGHMLSVKRKSWAKAFFDLPVEYEPGTHFLYNTGATYMLSAIVQKVTGQKLIDYLRPRLFDPLGIEDPTWDVSPQGINTGGFGLSIRTEDIARFGQLYLQKGQWQGQQLLPAAWVEEATTKHVSNANATNPNLNSDWEQGYGYQFWRCRHNIYRGDGAFGQYCIVMPEQDAVLAMTCGTDLMQPVLDLVWSHLLPAMQPPAVKLPALPEDKRSQTGLQDRLASLALLPPRGMITSPLVSLISGKRYHFEANKQQLESIKFDFQGDSCLVTFVRPDGPRQLQVGCGVWCDGQTDLFDGRSRLVAASGVWTDESTYQITARLYETPAYYHVICHFCAGQAVVEVKSEAEAVFGPRKTKKLTAKAE